nr:MAG TPA: hypothetical protein [Caudoviricetes sp.]
MISCTLILFRSSFNRRLFRNSLPIRRYLSLSRCRRFLLRFFYSYIVCVYKRCFKCMIP